MNTKEFSTKILPIIEQIRDLRQDMQPEVKRDCEEGSYESLWVKTSDTLTTVLVGLSELEQCVGHGHGNLNFFKYRSPTYEDSNSDPNYDSDFDPDPELEN